MSTNADAPLVTTFAGLPDGYCFTSWNKLALDIVAGMGSYIPGSYTVIISSDTAPAAEDRGKLWYKTVGGAPTGRVYSYYGGYWSSPHPIEPGGEQRLWWEGDLTSLGALDEGVLADPVTDFTGPFWEEDTNYKGRFPFHYGTIGANIYAIGGTGGADMITLAANTMPAHEHFIANNDLATSLLSTVNYLTYAHGAASLSTDYVLYGTTQEPTMGQTSTTGGDGAGATVPFLNMPPYRVGMWAKRTQRKYFVG
jgi:hypothetical protein